MLVLQISGLVCYSVPLGYSLISARAIIIISTYAERKVSVPVGYRSQIHYNGKETKKALYPPELSAHIFPLCALIILSAIDSPRP